MIVSEAGYKEQMIVSESGLKEQRIVSGLAERSRG
jgi:hypothetical protein